MKMERPLAEMNAMQEGMHACQRKIKAEIRTKKKCNKEKTDTNQERMEAKTDANNEKFEVL
jgi:hypothetical protein